MTTIAKPSTLADLTAEEILERFAPTNYRENTGAWADHHIDFEVGPATAELHCAYNAFRTVYSVHVDPDHRGKGHGRRLMEVITAYADVVGMGLNLSAYADNEPAIRLYKSVGFKIVHTRNDNAWGRQAGEIIHSMERYPTRIPPTPAWDAHFEAKALKLERDHEPRLGSDYWIAFFDALRKAQQERPDLGRARYSGSRNYEENTRRLSCDATGAALEAAGWRITRIEEQA